MLLLVSGTYLLLIESMTRFLIPWLFPDLQQSVIAQLGCSVKFDEVKTSLFHIGSLKEPGFDGFPAKFFHQHWNLLGKDVF